MKIRHPARTIVLGTGLLLAADMAAWTVYLTLRLAAFLVLPAAAAVVAYRAGCRRTLPPLRVVRGTVLRADDRLAEVDWLRSENAALRDEVDQLRADLYDARLQAAAAWDAASSVPPRPPRPVPPAITRLLADRMSGVRALFPEDDQ